MPPGSARLTPQAYTANQKFFRAIALLDRVRPERQHRGRHFVNLSSGNRVGTSANPLDALLAPLALNGGATQTQALLAGSPAINAGNPSLPGSGGVACAATDQRGVVRPLGPVCDMGAYEAGERLFLSLIWK